MTKLTDMETYELYIKEAREKGKQEAIKEEIEFLQQIPQNRFFSAITGKVIDIKARIQQLEGEK